MGWSSAAQPGAAGSPWPAGGGRGGRGAVAAASGPAALPLALLAHGVGPGDEVITTPLTFQATANMVLAVGARPVFVDVGEDGNIDPALVEAAITPRTKALLPVHLYGRLCGMTALSAVAESHGLVIIEDAAQAHGASLGGPLTGSGRSRRAGSFGTGCFSLYATKNVTAGEGGLISTDDAELAERLRRLRSHGEGERYESVELGYNYRLTDVAAAIALAQLARLPELTERRRANPRRPSRVRGPGGRAELGAWLRERGIEAGVYYPKTLPAQPLYRKLGYDEAVFPVARRLAREVLPVPGHPP